jgi:antitoxin ParD1/3/4
MPPKASLNVSLTPQLTAYVSALVATGQYRSAAEVMRAGLRLLQRENLRLDGRSTPETVWKSVPGAGPGKRRTVPT